MSSYTLGFLKSSLIYFILAVILGIHLSVFPASSNGFRFAHVHFNLLGWMCMMIYGVGYHILPRFSGVPLYSEKMANIQLYLANAGLIGMALFYYLKVEVYNPVFQILFILSSILEGISIFMFVYNIFRTIKWK